MNNFVNELLNAKQQKSTPHAVSYSPWSILSAFSTFSLLLNTALFFHNKMSWNAIVISMILVIVTMFIWINDVLWESSIEKQHTLLIFIALRFGFMLFIVSEVMFFFSFFWTFFHTSLSPSVSVLVQWPPKYVPTLTPWGIPLLNTALLITSGILLTKAHYAIMTRKQKMAYKFLQLTIIFGLLFIGFQFSEYVMCPFSMNDSTYGSTFFMATGFHGLHVIVGTIFLIVTLMRLSPQQIIKTISFTTFFPTMAEEHLGFETAAYYWHFVDVVWLFLFIVMYMNNCGRI